MDESFFRKNIESRRQLFDGIVLMVHRDKIELFFGHVTLRE